MWRLDVIAVMHVQAEAMGHEGMAAKIMAKHSREEHRSSLHVTVVEARGLRPRHGRAATSAVIFNSTQFCCDRDAC